MLANLVPSHLSPSDAHMTTHPHPNLFNPLFFPSLFSSISSPLPTLALSSLKSAILFALANGPSSTSTNAFFRANSSLPGVLKMLFLLADVWLDVVEEILLMFVSVGGVRFSAERRGVWDGRESCERTWPGEPRGV
jgi:hypothetical protein